MASFLTAFTMGPALDADGRPIEIPVAVLPGFVSYASFQFFYQVVWDLSCDRQVVPFKFIIKARSQRWDDLVREAAVHAQDF
jgi:hypothetical protein